jgi:hypothetical protein
VTDLYSFGTTEKRKAWIYDVPLASVHHLRESLNGVDPDQPIPKELLAKYDAPVIAGVVKLWVLELDPPLTLWEGWDEIRKLYPSGVLFIQLTVEHTDSDSIQSVRRPTPVLRAKSLNCNISKNCPQR